MYLNMYKYLKRYQREFTQKSVGDFVRKSPTHKSGIARGTNNAFKAGAVAVEYLVLP